MKRALNSLNFGLIISSVLSQSDWTAYDCSFGCAPPSTGFLAGFENRAQEYVCVALGPVPFNQANDLAIPGKYEASFSGCNVVGASSSGDVEVSHRKFAILRNSSDFVWGPPVWAGRTPVTHPLGMTKGGTPVTICRTYRTATAVHSGYLFNNVCVYSFGGNSAASVVGAYDILWNVTGSTIPSNMIPVTPLPSTPPTPSPSFSPTRSATSSQTPSPSSTPAVAGANEVWIDRANALSLGYDKSAFVQSGTDNFGLDPIFVCRGELQSGFTGPMLTGSSTPAPGPLPLSFRSNFDAAVTLSVIADAATTTPGVIRVSLDEVNRRAFVIQRSSNIVAVVDLSSGSLLTSINLSSMPTEVLVVPTLNIVLISSSSGNSVTAFSLFPPFTSLWNAAGLMSASSLDVDAPLNALFVSTAGSIVRIDLTNPTAPAPPSSRITLTGTVIATSIRNSANSKLLYVAVPSGGLTSSIEIYRKTSLLKTSTWSMIDYGASDVLAFALDAKNSVLIAVAKSSSSSDQLLIVVNLLDGEVIDKQVLTGASQECSHLVFDASSGAIVITCGASSVFAFQQVSISSYRLLQRVSLPAGTTGSVAASYSSSLQILYVVVQAASGQSAKLYSYTIAALSAMPAPVSPFGLPAVVPGRFDLIAFSASVCVVPFNISDTSLYGPTIAYKLLLRSPTLVWGSSLTPLQRASSRPVLAGAVGGRNATVCRAWSNDCEKFPSRSCTPTGPHSGYVFLDDITPVCTYAYPTATVTSTSFDVLFNVAAAPSVSQTALPLPAASTSPSKTPSASFSMSAAVPGSIQWISRGTTDALFVGYDGSMLTDVVTVCRGLVNGEFVPGKRVNSNPFCNVPIHGIEVLDREFESLRNNQRLVWAPYSPSSTQAGTMVEMSYNFERAVICRARYNNDGSIHSGFTNFLPYYNNQQPTCLFSWGGLVKNNYTFDVLYMLPKPSETPTPTATPSSSLTPVTMTPTPTKTPTVSPTGTPSNSRTPSSTTTPTRTPTKTPTPTSTSSPSPSIGASTSPTRSVTKSVTSTPSASQQPVVIDAGFKLSNADGSASAVTQSVLAVAGIFSCLVAYAIYMGIGTRSLATTPSNATRAVVTDRTPLPIAWENDPTLSYAYVVPTTTTSNNSNTNQGSPQR